MSVILHGKEHYVQEIQGLLTLNLFRKEIKNISEIMGLENLTSLQVLKLSSNYISEIKGLENLTSLEVLDLSKNQISEINGLENLVNLKKLLLESNPIESLEGLDNLVNLKFVTLFNCKIHEIESFKNKENLTHLILGRNPLYNDLKYSISKKKKLSRMTEEERSIAGVNPNVWEVAINYRGKLLNFPKLPTKTKTSGGELVREGAWYACLECFTVVVFLVTFVSLPGLKLLK